MGKYFLVISLFIGSFNLNAQNEIKQIGGISLSEINITEYDKDKDAEAVVLFDYGQSKFIQNIDGGFNIYFTRHQRIKIFTKAGIAYGEFEIPIFQENNIYEKIIAIEGYTFNIENGGLTKTILDTKNQKFEEKFESGWLIRKYAMPNVKEGSVIDIKYTIESPYIFQLRDWNFQQKIPVIYSQYDVNTIPFYQYTWIVQGVSRFDIQESVKSKSSRKYANIDFNDLINKYALRDIPAFKDEKFISGIDDHIIKIDFQLSKIIYPTGAEKNVSTTWTAMIKDLSKSTSFGKFIKSSSGSAKKIIANMNLANKNETEKIKIITKYVKDNYNWNGYKGKYTQDSPKQFLKEKTGNVAEINLYLVALLNAAEIDAKPAILSTRGNGKILLDYPFFHYFDYTIVKAGSENPVLIDATENLLPYNTLPTRCINGKALVIDNEKVEWVTPRSFNTSIESQNLNIFVNIETRKLDITYKNMTTGYNALKFRKASNTSSLANEFSSIVDISENDMHVSNLDSVEKRFEISFTLNKDMEYINDKIYISPFADFAPSQNLFTQKQRSLAVDMVYRYIKQYSTTIEIPDNYQVISVPKNQNINNNNFQMHFDTQIIDGNKLRISAQYSFPKAKFDAQFYEKVKMMMDMTIKKFNEKIVLEKTDS